MFGCVVDYNKICESIFFKYKFVVQSLKNQYMYSWGQKFIKNFTTALIRENYHWLITI